MLRERERETSRRGCRESRVTRAIIEFYAGAGLIGVHGGGWTCVCIQRRIRCCIGTICGVDKSC